MSFKELPRHIFLFENTFLTYLEQLSDGVK